MTKSFREHWLRSCSSGVAALLVAFGLFASPFSSAADRKLDVPATAPETEPHPVRRAGGTLSPPTPSARATATTPPRATAPDRLGMFRGLGAWIDLYDMKLDPRATTALMARHGVRTLYIQTGRSNTPHGIEPKVGPWLAAAHERGLEVVGWYLPFYRDVTRDVRRTVAIKNYRWRGHAFDGLGIDIEYRNAVRGPARWNRRVVAHQELVRRAVGRSYPLASIPPTPLQMAVAPGHWAGFPWARLARTTDAMLLMSYWSDRVGCPRVRAHCAFEFTAGNVALTRRLMGTDDVIVHVIGGIGDRINTGQLRDFVRAARASGADGASIYDVVTTKSAWWRHLGTLRALGDRR